MELSAGVMTVTFWVVSVSVDRSSTVASVTSVLMELITYNSTTPSAANVRFIITWHTSIFLCRFVSLFLYLCLYVFLCLPQTVWLCFCFWLVGLSDRYRRGISQKLLISLREIFGKKWLEFLGLIQCCLIWFRVRSRNSEFVLTCEGMQSS